MSYQGFPIKTVKISEAPQFKVYLGDVKITQTTDGKVVEMDYDTLKAFAKAAELIVKAGARYEMTHVGSAG